MIKPVLSMEALREPSRYVALCIVLLSFLLYIPFLTVPFLPDDYLQITMARKLGSISQWPRLFEDPLFRNRATSIVMTHWTDWLFPLSPIAFGISSILLHAFNSLLVYGLGSARSIGWQLSALTAMVFALQERHHEAVVWYASQPELLVFTFVLITLLLWLRWLHGKGRAVLLWPPMLLSFAMALLSKESAVAAVPLLMLLAWFEKSERRRTLVGLIPFAVIALAYVAWIFQGQAQNHHFADGTFAVQAGFIKTAVLSTGRGLWVWGWVGLALLLAAPFRHAKRERDSAKHEHAKRERGSAKHQERLSMIVGALLWMVTSLLPYSFLTYMTTVPSRHQYLAAVGCSLIVAIAMIALYRRTGRRRVVLACFLVIGIHHSAYLWTSKYRQFEKRSEPIEAFLHFLSTEPRRPVVIHCSDYLFSEARRAARLRLGEPEENLVLDLSTNPNGGPLYCLPKL